MVKRVEITEETPRILICCYGTLRKGQSNWKYLLQNKAQYLGTYSTEPKYTMYNRGGFPIVCDLGTTSITYDIFAITDYDTLENIHALEGCTGISGDRYNWYDIQEISTPKGQAYMYMMHTSILSLPKVSSGDWNSIVKIYKNERV